MRSKPKAADSKAILDKLTRRRPVAYFIAAATVITVLINFTDILEQAYKKAERIGGYFHGKDRKDKKPASIWIQPERFDIRGPNGLIIAGIPKSGDFIEATRLVPVGAVLDPLPIVTSSTDGSGAERRRIPNLNTVLYLIEKGAYRILDVDEVATVSRMVFVEEKSTDKQLFYQEKLIRYEDAFSYELGKLDREVDKSKNLLDEVYAPTGEQRPRSYIPWTTTWVRIANPYSADAEPKGSGH